MREYGDHSGGHHIHTVCGVSHPGHTSLSGLLPQCPAFKMETSPRARAGQKGAALPAFWNPPTVSRAASEDRLS